MDRRTLILAAAACLVAGPALAQTVADRVMRDLAQQGYTRIETSRTLLGRTQIVGTGPAGRREIIANPRTGEILRDLWQPGGGSTGSGGLISTEDDGGKGRGRGRGRGGDDSKGDDPGRDDSGGDDSGGDD